MTNNPDSERKYGDAIASCKNADRKSKEESKIDEHGYKLALTDLNAALPGLAGITLGKALMYKTWCLLQIFQAKQFQSLVYMEEPDDPILNEGQKCGLEAKKLLEQNNASVDEIKFINSILQNF